MLSEVTRCFELFMGNINMPDIDVDDESVKASFLNCILSTMLGQNIIEMIRYFEGELALSSIKFAKESIEDVEDFVKKVDAGRRDKL